MLENLLFSMNSTMPLFFIMLLGYVLHRTGFLSDAFVAGANKFVFYVALPVQLFRDLGKNDVRATFDGRYVLFCFAVTLACILVIWALAKLFLKGTGLVGEFVQVCYRSSAAILGSAFLQSIYGDASMSSLMILGSVPLYNIMAVVILMLEAPTAQAQTGNMAEKLKKSVKGILTNPILLGIAAGFAWSMLQGCDHRCTYCIVPFARGNNRSVPEDEVLRQIGVLLEKGFEEICLTGVDACSYKPSFSGLVKKILEAFPSLPSLQFGSLDPAAVDDEFVALVGKYRNIWPHFHLSVQSGNNTILKRMRRRHGREEVIGLCAKIRAVRPEATFGADFICGFPTESEEAFMNTVRLVEEAGIGRLHVFPYSERPGTPAALMPQVPVEVRRKRAKILREKGEAVDD